MEQKLLNYGVLNQTKDEDLSSNRGQINENWEKSRYFSFGELMKFGFIEKGCCCCKKTKKYQLYQDTKETYEKRTDIINIMKTVADIDTLKDALLSDYQIRLLPYLANTKEDDDSDVKRMSVGEAVKELRKGDNEGRDDIKRAVDKYLERYLPKELLDGESEKLDLGDDGNGGLNNDGGIRVEDLEGNEGNIGGIKEMGADRKSVV